MEITFGLLFLLVPPLFVLIAAIGMVAQRKNRFGEHPFLTVPKLLQYVLGFGVVGAVVWTAGVILLLLITQSGGAGFWIIFLPWGFAAGEGFGLYRWFKAEAAARATAPPSPTVRPIS